MNKGYDSASISVLQEELGMSRGAMYRYFKNKEDLFFAVIDEYFFKIFEKILAGVKDDITVPELIDAIHRRQKLITNAFMRAGVTHTVFLNYTALMIQAAKHYPDFVNRFGAIHYRLLAHWRNALLKSIELKEIREDIDIEIMCILFNNTGVKENSGQSCDEARFVTNVAKDMERRKEVMDYLYNLIKI
jgi:AcrR family transcriptional regulator